MVEDTFSITNAWNIDPPCYVRKVDRPSHSQDADALQKKVFCSKPDDNSISVFIVHSAMDLVRIAVALNANRGSKSKTDRLLLIAMIADELSGFVIQQTAGATRCKWANHLHHDLLITDATQTPHLTETLVRVGRKHQRFTKKDMEEALAATLQDGCHAADPNSERCVCEDELPASQSRSWLSRLGRIIAYLMARLFGKSGRSE